MFAACPKGVPPHATCGTVTVLLDSTHPSLGTIPIAFELYRHTDATHPALGTIVPSLGGPGISNTAADGLFLGLFGPLLDRWNLLLIDHRGIGRSAAIDCPAVQHGLGLFAAAVRACWTKLGAAATLYGTNQAADDIDAVRAALGFGKIDYLGASYGWHDVAAYAQRHPDHLRAAILETPKPIEDDTLSAALAYNCNDGQFVWDNRAPEATRQAQYNAALAGIGSATAPFSPAAWAAFVSQRQIPGPGADSCISWTAPTPGTLIYSPTTVFPHTQVLIMGGSLDLVPPSNIQRIQKYFPAGKVVMVANAGHFTGVWSPCAQRIDLEYIETLRIGDTSCASNPNEPFHAFGASTTTAVPYRAVARFPRLAAQAIPAKVDPEGNDASTASDRRVASVAWSTIDDALTQAARVSGSTGRGLRGGALPSRLPASPRPSPSTRRASVTMSRCPGRPLSIRPRTR
jgi:pimeloyl-ACP methyl ester carboxylesterase